MDAIQMAEHVLLTFAILFMAGIVVGKVADVIKIPDVVLFLLVGIMIGPQGINLIHVPVDSTLNQLTLLIGAAFLLFHGGTSVSFNVLKSVWITLLLLSTVAVMVMVIIVGYTASVVLGIGLLPALLLAAVLAPTDPATLVPIFLQVKIKDRLAQTIVSESAFNDATGAIVAFAIVGMMTTGQLSLMDNISKFFIMAIGGIIIGSIYGLIAGYITTDKSAHMIGEYAHALLLPVIIFTYMTAEYFGASGFMAVFTAGLVCGNLAELGWQMQDTHHKGLHGFIEIGSLLLRMTIFILLGTHVDFGLIGQYLLPGCIIIAVFMFVARPLAVLLCTLPDQTAKWSRNEILFMFWTRETGVIPATLSGMLIGMRVEHADVIASITFMAILVTLVMQASSTKWLAGKLGLLEL